MKWITRERVRIDRVSSAWLIKKFVDPGFKWSVLAAQATGVALLRLADAWRRVVASRYAPRGGRVVTCVRPCTPSTP